jgi:cytochrome c551/c552
MRGGLKLTVVLIAAGFLAGGAMAQAGQSEVNPTFKRLHCGACHKTEGKGTGLSLEKIAAGYKGKSELLTAYLAGQGQAQINPAKARIMASQIKKTEKLTPQERKGLVDYLLSF